MNRRDAIAALMALPATARITRATVQATDVIVLEIPERISAQTEARLRLHLAEIWPDQRVLILSNGAAIKVIDARA
jgi:hypothetical protein